MKIFRHVNGHCPKFDQYETIEIEYIEIKTIGQMQTHYKRGSYCCEYEAYNGCDISDANGRCPIYNSAPVSITD